MSLLPTQARRKCLWAVAGCYLLVVRGVVEQALARDSLDSPDFTLFYTQETAPLARKVASATNHVNLGTVRWKCVPRSLDCFPLHSPLPYKS